MVAYNSNQWTHDAKTHRVDVYKAVKALVIEQPYISCKSAINCLKSRGFKSSGTLISLAYMKVRKEIYG